MEIKSNLLCRFHAFVGGVGLTFPTVQLGVLKLSHFPIPQMFATRLIFTFCADSKRRQREAFVGCVLHLLHIVHDALHTVRRPQTACCIPCTLIMSACCILHFGFCIVDSALWMLHCGCCTLHAKLCSNCACCAAVCTVHCALTMHSDCILWILLTVQYAICKVQGARCNVQGGCFTPSIIQLCLCNPLTLPQLSKKLPHSGEKLGRRTNSQLLTFPPLRQLHHLPPSSCNCISLTPGQSFQEDTGLCICLYHCICICIIILFVQIQICISAIASPPPPPTPPASCLIARRYSSHT